MCEIPVFREEDYSNLELVRQVVLRRLKEDEEWDQFDRTWGERGSLFVRFEPNNVRSRFITLANVQVVSDLEGSERTHSDSSGANPDE